MHEFVISLSGLKKKTGISAMDIAKGLLDNGIHPPTMYFPLIVDEADDRADGDRIQGDAG